MNLTITNIDINTTDTSITFPLDKLKGNIVSHKWYNSITLRSGRPDLPTISLLSEAVYWNRPSKNCDNKTGTQLIMKFAGDAWQTSYAYLSKKFGFSHETIRRSLVKLEKLGAIRREFKKVTLRGQVYNNVMFIHLGENIHKFLTPASSSKPVFFKPEHEAPSPHGCGHHIDNKIKKIKSRSKESNFIEKDLREEKKKEPSQLNLKETTCTEDQCNLRDTPLTNDKPENLSEDKSVLQMNVSLPDKIKSKFTGNRRKPITEFSPISEEEAYSLRMSSGRKFSLSYINKLIEKLGKKYPGHGFYTGALFLKYISLVLANELREATAVNNESFRFKAFDEESRKQEYLKEIEESEDSCKQSRLRRKIACSFDTETSYRILTSCRFREEIRNNSFTVQVSEPLNLSENQYKTLLDSVRSVYGKEIGGNDITDIDFILKGNSMKYGDIGTLVLNLGEEGSAWNKISTRLLNYYGEATHRSWFSKLQAQEDKESKRILLKASSNFIESWIKSNYLTEIIEASKNCGQSIYQISMEA